MGDVVSFDEKRLEKYLVWAICSFLNDGPDTDFQRGYLAALVDAYREGLGREGDARIKAAANIVYGGE